MAGTPATDTLSTGTAGPAGTLSTGTLSSDTAGPAERTAPVPVADVPVAPAGPGPAADAERHPDRLFLVRLLVVIVVAALIGSVLVLLLR